MGGDRLGNIEHGWTIRVCWYCGHPSGDGPDACECEFDAVEPRWQSVAVVPVEQRQGAEEDIARLECALQQVRSRLNEGDVNGAYTTAAKALPPTTGGQYDAVASPSFQASTNREET